MKPNQKVSLEKDAVDDREPEWRNLLSRIKANANVKPNYFVTVVTIIAVLFIGAGATYVRGQVLQAELMEAHGSGSSLSTGSGVSGANDPYATALPPELIDSQNETENATGQQILDANLKVAGSRSLYWQPFSSSYRS